MKTSSWKRSYYSDLEASALGKATQSANVQITYKTLSVQWVQWVHLVRSQECRSNCGILKKHRYSMQSFYCYMSNVQHLWTPPLYWVFYEQIEGGARTELSELALTNCVRDYLRECEAYFPRIERSAATYTMENKNSKQYLQIVRYVDSGETLVWNSFPPLSTSHVIMVDHLFFLITQTQKLAPKLFQSFDLEIRKCRFTRCRVLSSHHWHRKIRSWRACHEDALIRITASSIPASHWNEIWSIDFKRHDRKGTGEREQSKLERKGKDLEL